MSLSQYSFSDWPLRRKIGEKSARKHDKSQEFKSLAPIAKYTIIALAFFMALDQLGVAATIVNSAFIIVLSGFALAFGLSFGLGGKDFASRYLSTFERKMQNTEIEKNRKNQNPPNDM